MKTLRNFFEMTGRMTSSRFDRYYAEVAKSGAGYPTADEARRDMRRHDVSNQSYGWMR